MFRSAVGDGAVAVSLHDVEPGTFARVALLRDWLGDLGVGRVTLLVVPAADLHPLADRSPELGAWLCERVAAGDAVAQHGFHHAPGRRGEFARLDERDARRAVLAGRRLLALAGVRPRGFVAPGFAYPPPLLRALRATCDWWATANDLHDEGGRRVRRAPALAFGSRERGAASWRLLPRAGGSISGELLRLEVHPDVLDDPRAVGRLERVVAGAARRRRAVTVDELCPAPALAAA